jgi:glutamate--cysteine ligase
VRQLQSRRYDRMEAYFDALEHDVPVTERLGRAMMTSTAATQLNLDAGEDPAARWHLLHDLGPVMIAAFANSPAHGWKSARQRIWQGLDPVRTAPPVGADPVTAYAEMALDAPVMLETGRGRFRDWVFSADPPTTHDLDEHLTTLFPPVRPRGWFEVRYLDAQPVEWWAVPIAVLSSLLDDPLAASLAAEAAAPARGLWERAGRDGLDDPVLHQAAQRCFAIALDSLDRHDPLLVGLVSRFAESRIDQRKAVS